MPKRKSSGSNPGAVVPVKKCKDEGATLDDCVPATEVFRGWLLPDQVLDNCVPFTISPTLQLLCDYLF